MFNVPILLIIFNRPDAAQQVFNVIRSMQPRKLFVAADGPRPGMKGEVGLCEKSRRIATSVDWECEVYTLFRDQNLGCGLGPSSAITWFFENVEEGIILEDDCVPSYSFFQFCETLLDYYRDTHKVMHISGNNFQLGKKRGKGSYYFSRFTHSAGWATWRRAWKYYDFNLMPKEHRAHAWDIQWELSVKGQNGIAVLPNVPLINNIGFGPNATHTKGPPPISFLSAGEIVFPLIHPDVIRINKAADIFTEYTYYRNNSNTNLIWLYQIFNLWAKIKSFGKKFISKTSIIIPFSIRIRIRRIFGKL